MTYNLFYYQSALVTLAYRLLSLGRFPAEVSLLIYRLPPSVNFTHLSPPWYRSVRLGPNNQPTNHSCSAVGATFCLALVSWHQRRLVMSVAVSTLHPGATPSTLFTLGAFTRSSCSSTNDAGFSS